MSPQNAIPETPISVTAVVCVIMETTTYTNFYQIHPAIRKFITQLVTNGATVIGIPSGNIEVIKFTTPPSINDELSDTKYADRFTLNVPYAGHYLKWEIIFRNDDISFAPDLDLYDDCFLNNFSAAEITELLPSWANWDAKNPRALNKLLSELLGQYKKYQVRLLEQEKYSRLLFEYTSLIDELGMNCDNIEILVNELTQQVVFLMVLDVDISGLPHQLQLPNTASSSSAALLMVTFQQRVDGSQSQHPQLFLDSNLENLLGGPSTSKHIPQFPVHGCLADYVPSVRRLLEDKVKFIYDNFDLKLKYIAHLLAVRPTGVLEYDTELYTKASILFTDEDDYHYLLYITLTSNFPKEKPKCILRSVYKKNVNEHLNDYPYSPRWTPQEMIKRLFKYIVLERFTSFKLKSE